MNIDSFSEKAISRLIIYKTLLLMEKDYDKDEYNAVSKKIDKLKLYSISLAKKCRKTYAYTIWQKEVKKRDNYECKNCKSKDNLHSHHIKPFKSYPLLRLVISNGITLCKPCHISVHSGGNNVI